MTRFLANLDCETTWAAEAAAARGCRPRVRPLPGRLLARLSALGTLLGALTRPGDRLWTPLPVAAERVRPGPGGARPVAESGVLAELPATDGVIAWGETAAVAAHRARGGTDAAARGDPAPHWLAALRSGSPPPPDVARRTANRAVSAGLAQLPGSAWIRSREDLVRHLTGAGAGAAAGVNAGGRWVLKAPFGAAGRDRLRGSGTDVAGGDLTRLERLLALHERLRLEPWVQRTADFGALGLVERDGVRSVGLHALDMSGGGGLRGIRPIGAAAEEPGPGERVLLERSVGNAGAALRSLGYRGPFGVDAFRYVDAHGGTHFHTPCEINARLTFGFVARALAEAAGWDPAGTDRAPELRFGTRSGLDRAGDAAWPLLLPGADDPAAAWLAG